MQDPVPAAGQMFVEGLGAVAQGVRIVYCDSWVFITIIYYTEFKNKQIKQ